MFKIIYSVLWVFPLVAYEGQSDGKTDFLYGNRKLPKSVSFSPKEIEATKKIKHLIVIMQENWSFDGLLGTFPGVNGLAQAKKESYEQVDIAGVPFAELPTCYKNARGNYFPVTYHVYKEIPKNLPNAPFNLKPYVAMDRPSGDMVHYFYNEIQQIHGGKMNGFAVHCNAGGLTMSYYDIL